MGLNKWQWIPQESIQELGPLVRILVHLKSHYFLQEGEIPFEVSSLHGVDNISGENK